MFAAIRKFNYVARPAKRLHQLSSQEPQFAQLPKPGNFRIIPKALTNVRILLISNLYNRMTKRVKCDLDLLNAETCLITVGSSGNTWDQVEATSAEFQPDIIVCPYLTSRIPASLYNSGIPCLVVHPGVPGDRGSSSLDWTLRQRKEFWGVTCLQAKEKLDSGEVWSTQSFKIKKLNKVTKTGLYNGQVCAAASAVVVDSVLRFCDNIPPTLLDYNHPEVIGSFNKRIKDEERKVDWAAGATEAGAMIRCSDTQPGAVGEISLANNQDERKQFRVYGSSIAENIKSYTRDTSLLAPGTIIGRRNESLLISCGDEQGVWISNIKDMQKDSIKLPASVCIPERWLDHIEILPQSHDIYYDIKVYSIGKMSYIHFNFYNGAMSVAQCRRLENTIKEVADANPEQVIVLMGGARFFSSGIHLNMIEASSDPFSESWDNINAINDVIKTIYGVPNVVVSCLQSDAAAGGLMLALSADLIFSHSGVLLSPSYRSMALYGSEYWTYSLPKRVGGDMASKLTNSEDVLTANEAVSIGLIDGVLGQNCAEMLMELPQTLDNIPRLVINQIMNLKREKRDHVFHKKLQHHRDIELRHMLECFSSPEYNKARHNFVCG